MCPFGIMWLLSVYHVLGAASCSQSVFTTNHQAFSPIDLTAFQKLYDCVVQSAISVGGQDVTSCNLGSGDNQCYEGNLDIQYIMGIAQATTSIYYHIPSTSGNPFVSSIL